MKFTDYIAEYIDQNELNLRNLTIVLPSERAIKYISSALYQRAGKPLLAPEMITIDRWIRKHSESTVIDKTRLLIKLFSIQLENPADPKDTSFDEFQSWGQILLSDFDEIDRYLLSPKQVFRNLADIREIENWSFNSTEPTPAQKRFMDFWDRLPDYYVKLNELLEKEKRCYPGKAYRYVSENIHSLFENKAERIFLFAGFNALSKSEISIMKQLHQMGRAHILIDVDQFYFNDPIHEAGLFHRSIMKQLGIREISLLRNELETATKEITVIECVQQTGQVKSAASILKDLSAEELDETLVLLADESLIVPMLRNIPASVKKANITLGLPLKSTALKTWIDLLFNFQENRSRFKTESIYFQDLQKFWNHPFVTAIMTTEEEKRVIKLELEAIANNRIFRNKERIPVSEKLDQLLALSSADWKDDWSLAISKIRESVRYLNDKFQASDEFNRALVQSFEASIIDFSNIVNEGIPPMSLRSFKTLLNQHWSNKSIAYHGNPIDGLQIMGLLETRLLDFKNIIVLGLNEGKMPPTNPIQTMIPMDLRAALELPTPREKQGLFAHHFYRLLHCCERMWVTFSSARESVGSNEASRYLLQLELELTRINRNIRWQKKLYTIPEEKNSTEKSAQIPKSRELIQKLDEIFARSISASAMKKYLECPLDFYYRYLLEFGEDEDFEEDVESRTIGSFIHEVLEELYEPYARHDKNGELKADQPSAITSFDVEAMLKRYDMLVRKQYMKRYNNDERAFTTGKNLLSFNMTLELTKRILESEKDFLLKQKEPVFIEFLEMEIKAPVQMEIFGSHKEIMLKGIIDRIDTVGGKVRIIDYKSGKVNDTEVLLQSSDDPEMIMKSYKSTKHVLQLVMYGFLYREKFGSLPDEIGLYSMIKISNGLFSLQGKKEATLEDLINTFPVFLKTLMEDIYDESQDFEHESGWNKYCLYCE